MGKQASAGKLDQQSYKLVKRELSFTQGTDTAVVQFMRDCGHADLREAYRSLVSNALRQSGYKINAT